MSWFFIDIREQKTAMCEAIDRFEEEQKAISTQETKERMENHRAAMWRMKRVIIDESTFLSDSYGFEMNIRKLCLAGNYARAKKLVGALDDRIPRLWWIIPLRILLWPFIFIYRVIKLGLP